VKSGLVLSRTLSTLLSTNGESVSEPLLTLDDFSSSYGKKNFGVFFMPHSIKLKPTTHRTRLNHTRDAKVTKASSVRLQSGMLCRNVARDVAGSQLSCVSDSCTTDYVHHTRIHVDVVRVTWQQCDWCGHLCTISGISSIRLQDILAIRGCSYIMLV